MAEGNERYRLGRLLGRGGVAEVYEAIGVDAHGMERRLALKRWLDVDEAQLTAFADEAKVASRLHHPNLVRVMDYGILDDRPFLALELVEGLDLGELCRRVTRAKEKLPTELALFITLEVAHGLAHAHEQRGADGRPLGVVHRDVSPANILISGGGEVKLADFGIAWFADRTSKTAVGTVKGKRSYMAPEQALGEAVDARTDVFSLGCVLAFLLTGESPLGTPEAAEGILRGAEVPLPPNLPADLAPILSKALARDPNRRFRTAAELAEALGGALYPRVQKDPRSLLRAFLPRFALEKPVRTPLEELMDVARVLEPGAGLPRFNTTVQARLPQERPSTPTGATTTQAVSPFPQPSGQKVLNTQRIKERQGAIGVSSDAPSDSDERPASGEEPDPLIGSVLHGYRLTGVLGRGALARVYRAEHLVLAREYAVKILYGRAADNERSQKRLEREAVTLSRLLHPNIVQVVDFGFTADDRPFLTMELLEGRTISQTVKTEGALSGERTAAIARQIAAALDHAHTLQVIHRDLKPGNVMLIRQPDGAERVKVLDFGIARLGDQTGTRLTSADSLLGTPRYMAPEQIAGAGGVGPPADLYALGTVMYAMLSGRPPFVGKTMDVVEMQLNQMPAPLTTETGLEELVFELLAKRPEDRPPNAAAVIARIDAVGLAEPALTVAIDQDSTVAVESPENIEPTASISLTRPQVVVTRSHRGPLLLAVLGLMAAGVVLGFAWTRSRLATAPPVVSQGALPPPTPVEPEIRAVAQPEIRPVPLPKEPPPPVKSSEGPKTSRSAPGPKEPSVGELAAEVRQELRALGLSGDDLALIPNLSEAKAQLDQAIRTKDEAAARTAHAAVRDRLRRFQPDEELFAAKLRRIAEKLKLSESRLPEVTFDRLENRYLDLLAGSKSNPGRGQLVALDQLEREVEQARR
ncbi:MAG: serine/threonine protein kinase [Deltaproteobacteria bacterium]|nr:serine/threonine protein kinase [Deltaproteobacteria bacterium]